MVLKVHPMVCAISGGTSGVGLATAVRLAKAGHQIAICGRDSDRLMAANRIIADSTNSNDVLAVVADMSRSSEAQRFVHETTERFSRIDLLVNNAAMAPMDSLDSMSDEDIDACIDLNIRGVYYATRTAWIQMKRQGFGLVINVSSQAAVDPFPGFSMYGSTKAWIELFTVALANEGRQFGIRSYCVRPGAIETPMLRGLFEDFPAEQCVSADEVAEVIESMCTPAWTNSSGQIVKVSRQ